MAFTTLDSRTALIVIDLQKGIVSRAPPSVGAAVLANSAALARAFRARGLPVVLVNVVGVAPGRSEQALSMAGLPADFAELADALDPQPSDHRISKRTWGAFTNTGLEGWLRGQGVTQVVICGVATSIGVESTARFASEAGFNVSLVVDAMTDLVPDAHQHSTTRIFPRLGETGSTADLLQMLGAHA